MNAVPETAAPMDVPSIVTDFRSGSRTVPVMLCRSVPTLLPSAGLIETRIGATVSILNATVALLLLPAQSRASTFSV